MSAGLLKHCTTGECDGRMQVLVCHDDVRTRRTAVCPVCGAVCAWESTFHTAILGWQLEPVDDEDHAERDVREAHGDYTLEPSRCPDCRGTGERFSCSARFDFPGMVQCTHDLRLHRTDLAAALRRLAELRGRSC